MIQQVHITLGHGLCAIAEDAIAKDASAAPPLNPSAPQRGDPQREPRRA